jgi:putative tricarboxylic transport membrane protein
MKRLSKNALGAIGVAAATLVYLNETRKLPFGSIHNPEIGFMPILAGWTLLGLCLLLLGKEFFGRERQKPKEVDLFEDEERGESAGIRKPLILSAAVFVYPLAFVSLGYILSTILLVTLSLRVMKYRGWIMSLLIAVGVSLVSYFIFAGYLEVQLPRGILR